jgi:hypothetical protein
VKIQIYKQYPGKFNRQEFTQVFLGIAEGFGLNLLETCVEDSLEFEGQVQSAIEKFVSKDAVLD